MNEFRFTQNFDVRRSPLASPHALQLRSFRQRLPAAEGMVTFTQVRVSFWTLTVDTSGPTKECNTLRGDRQVKTRRAGLEAKLWQGS